MSDSEVKPKPRPRRSLVESFEETCNEEERAIARVEPAWGKAALFFRTGYRLGHPARSMRAMSLVEIRELLEVHRMRASEGNTLSLLHAVSLCAEENLPLPSWLAAAFKRSMDRFLSPGGAHSLDEVFASRLLPTQSPKKAAAAKQDWQLGTALCWAAWELAQDDESLASFDQVVDRLLADRDYGVRKTKAKRLITMIEVNQSQFLGKTLSISRFLAKRRKPLP